jgi:anthranilate synthase/aminodeoxychorismate synthase-like glutamine amidotransferase
VVRWQADVVSGARVLVIDNYDSFVYNLVQYLGELGAEPVVHRNDEFTVQQCLDLKPDAVLLSPGPGRPEDAGILCDLIGPMASTGVPCLGHQAIGHVFGGDVVRAPHLMHGKTSEVNHDGTGVFAGVENPVRVTRYHSLVVERSTLPTSLRVTAETADGLVMGLRHESLAVHGVQFHPESILTEHGHRMLENFLSMAGASRP